MSAATSQGGNQRVQVSQSQTSKKTTDSDLPDTALWNGQAQAASVIPSLPPIPPQCMLPSDISSGGLAGNSQSFLNTRLSVNIPDEHCAPQPIHLAQHGSLSLQMFSPGGQFQPEDLQNDSFIQSATEVVTPSPRGSPDLGLNSRFYHDMASVQAAIDGLATKENRKVFKSSQAMEIEPAAEHGPPSITTLAVRPSIEPGSAHDPDDTDASVLSVRQILPNLQTIMRHVSAHPTFNTRLNNHEHRLDLIENASSSYVGAQEVYEQFGLLDDRVGVLENQIDDIEKMRGSDAGHDPVPSQTHSEMISAAIDRSEIFTRLETLESEFTDFKSSVQPSYAHPWIVEAVFLPFGNNLKGIWSTAEEVSTQRSRHNSMAPDNRTQTQSSGLTGYHDMVAKDWTGQRSWVDMCGQRGWRDDWLVAKACGSGSKVEERLRSRGLVKLIEVKGPNARDVETAMFGAFGHLSAIFHTDAVDPEMDIPASLKRFDGLQAPWIPLRKVHKDSKLQFLYPSEMANPTLWNVTFLSNVAMRAKGIKRLYVTQRESYMQQAQDPDSLWTWQRLRLLPRVFADVDSSGEVREADALEACWSWDERLDPPPSVHSSFTSQHSCLSIRRAPSHHSNFSGSNQSTSPAVSPVLSTMPTSIAHARARSPLMERFRPLHTRTTSMPSLVPLKFSPSQGKRRIASFDHDHHGPSSPQSSPIRPTTSLSTKRRRTTRSPSRPRDTPRWSVPPPSPYGVEETVEYKRGTTPFAYATPHSNAPYIDYRHQSVGVLTDDNHDDHGSTTDVDDLNEGQKLEDFDSETGQGHKVEDSDWEGVDDEKHDDDSDQEHKALSEDDDDAASDLSSQPSEYPSTQPGAVYSSNRGSFRIHVDEE
jgi:hypothetical protein